MSEKPQKPQEPIPFLSVNGEEFAYLRSRAYESVHMYQNDEHILRIGPAEVIEPEITFHEQVTRAGFPVPKFISSGRHENQTYFIEERFGSELLGVSFQQERTHPSDVVSDERFAQLLHVAEQVAQAQLRTARPGWDAEAFARGIHFPALLEELPDRREELLEAFTDLTQRLEALPRVITHGDFNPFNLFPEGIIDFGSSFRAPLGYDLATLPYHGYNFPYHETSEMRRAYNFSPAQVARYLETMDALYESHGYPALSAFLEDYLFARAIWATVKMHRFPELQRWRYARFHRLLDAYLAGESLVPLVTSSEEYRE